MSGRRREMAAMLGVVVALTGCGDAPPSRDLRVTIVDPEGRPIPGAVFYAEARDDSGAFACLVALAGDAGEVPDVAWKAAGLGWRPGSRSCPSLPVGSGACRRRRSFFRQSMAVLAEIR